MDATTAIAIYAAVVASVAALIQLAQWLGTRTQITLKANAGVAPVLSNAEDRFGHRTEIQSEVVFIHVTNRSPHPVKVTHLGAVALGRDAKKGLFFARPYPLHLKVPLEISARDSITLWQPRSDLAKWETEKMRLVATTAAGENFHSSAFLLYQLTRLEALP